jgi:serine/threonine protein kinase
VPREGAPGHVAVKLLHPNMLADPSNVQRFLREARAAAAVPCEHVAQVLSVGNAPNGVPFIVMELLEGHDLAFYLRRAAQLPLRQVVELVEHTSRALAAVRDAGIVHRDLKPGNIFLTDTLPRRWKVLDFGLSKLQGAEAITKDQAVGTPSYMAPEQVKGDEVDHLADLYALTAIRLPRGHRPTPVRGGRGRQGADGCAHPRAREPAGVRGRPGRRGAGARDRPRQEAARSVRIGRGAGGRAHPGRAR